MFTILNLSLRSVPSKTLYTANVTVLLLLLLLLAAYGFRKISKLKKENSIDKFYDVQTNLLNQAGFVKKFETDISDFSRAKYHLAYFMIDSNYLKAYCKNIAFSDVVMNVANTLKNSVRHYEFTGRITESGFVMVLHEENEIDATKRVLEILESFSAFDGFAERNAAGVLKVSLYRMEDHDNSCEELLFNLRRNCAGILDRDEQYVYCGKADMNRIQVEKETARELSEALARGEFKLYVQFIVDNKTKEIVSAEALSRWENPQTGIQFPGAYLNDMMHTGIITDFDYYMFEKVCEQLQSWKGTFLEKLTLSCNFTRITISEEDFVEKIEKIAKKYDFDRAKLIMEITEETLEQDRERALKNIRNCKKYGFKIALDDFCSGFTSPVNLCEYPIDIVKIDRGVLLNIEREKGKDLFKGLVALGHSLELKIVCEGVETEEQHNYVTSTACDYIQGWFFSKAIPARGSEEFVKNFSA